MRAFLAFDLDEQLVNEAAALAAGLRGHRALARARWVAPAVMHVTFRFLGDIEPERVGALSELVATVGAGRRAVSVRATSLVAFSHARRARVLALSLEDAGALGALVAEAEPALASLGFEPEGRAYRPHLTIARLREPADLRRLVAERAVSFAGTVRSISLYESHLGEGGPRYVTLARSELQPPSEPTG